MVSAMGDLFVISTLEMLKVCAVYTARFSFYDAANVISAVAALWRNMDPGGSGDHLNVEGVRLAYELTDEQCAIIQQIFRAYTVMGMQKLYENGDYEP